MARNIIKAFEVLLTLLTISFFVYISLHNELVADDFGEILMIDTLGNDLFRFVTSHYMGHTGRFLFHFPFYLGAQLVKLTGEVYLFNLVTFLLLYISLYYVMKKAVIPLISNIPVKGWQIHIWTILFLITFFYSTFDIDDVWFWMMGAAVYLWPFCLTGILIAILPHVHRNVLLLITACLLAGLLGMSVEVYSPYFVMVYGLFLLMRLRLACWDVKQFFKEKKNLYYLIPFLFMMAGLILLIAAPGNYVRAKTIAATHQNFFQEMIASLKYFLKVIILERGWILLMLLLTWTGVGLINRNLNVPSRKAWLLILCSAVGFGFVLITTFTFLITVKGGTWPFRSWTFISYAFATALMVTGIATGILIANRGILTNPQRGNIMYVAGLAGLCIITGKDLYHHMQILPEYNRAVEERLEYINQLKITGFEGVLELDSLPPSGYVKNQELSADSTHQEYFRNRDYKLYYHIPFEVRVKSGKSKKGNQQN